MRINYFDLPALITIYQKTIEVSGGGISGIRDKGQIESILEHIKNDNYYPSFINKLTYLFFSLNRSHCFIDGNKRIAISASVLFLNYNGYLSRISDFIIEMENIAHHVAAGKIGKDLLEEIITAVIYDILDKDEGLKFKIVKAIS